MGSVKHTYWCGVLYPENMIDNWQDDIEMKVQLPFAYCIHNQDLNVAGEDRKTHVHLILAWPAPTTYNNALSVFDRLSAPYKKALNKIEPVVSMEMMYKYLIHDTDSCRKAGKHLYAPSDRICGNNFDIDTFVKTSTADKVKRVLELGDLIVDKDFRNFRQFYKYCRETYNDQLTMQCLTEKSHFYECLITGNHYEAKNAGSGNNKLIDKLILAGILTKDQESGIVYDPVTGETF